MIIALDVRDWPCLIVGGGPVALRKAATLLQNGARVTVISPETGESSLRFQHLARPYRLGDCAGFRLVFACTNSRAVNAAVAGEARERGIPCNVADAPDESDFANVATVRRGEIEIGLSTGGCSAALAKHLRQKVEEAIGEEYAALAEILGARRAAFTQRGTAEARATAWRAVLESEALALLRAGQRAAAERLVDDILNANL